MCGVGSQVALATAQDSWQALWGIIPSLFALLLGAACARQHHSDWEGPKRKRPTRRVRVGGGRLGGSEPEGAE